MIMCKFEYNLEQLKIKDICNGCSSFNNTNYSCARNKELYRDYVKNTCKFYTIKINY